MNIINKNYATKKRPNRQQFMNKMGIVKKRQLGTHRPDHGFWEARIYRKAR